MMTKESIHSCPKRLLPGLEDAVQEGRIKLLDPQDDSDLGFNAGRRLLSSGTGFFGKNSPELLDSTVSRNSMVNLEKRLLSTSPNCG